MSTRTSRSVLLHLHQQHRSILSTSGIPHDVMRQWKTRELQVWKVSRYYGRRCASPDRGTKLIWVMIVRECCCFLEFTIDCLASWRDNSHYIYAALQHKNRDQNNAPIHRCLVRSSGRISQKKYFNSVDLLRNSDSYFLDY